MTKEELKKLYDAKIAANNAFREIAASDESFEQSIAYKIACIKAARADNAYDAAIREYAEGELVS